MVQNPARLLLHLEVANPTVVLAKKHEKRGLQSFKSKLAMTIMTKHLTRRENQTKTLVETTRAKRKATRVLMVHGIARPRKRPRKREVHEAQGHKLLELSKRTRGLQ